MKRLGLNQCQLDATTVVEETFDLGRISLHVFTGPTV